MDRWSMREREGKTALPMRKLNMRMGQLWRGRSEKRSAG
ncbi:NAC domain-containing protein [Psidium guajava]|nr:NAC domain-containing protein [Psidium guajava]